MYINIPSVEPLAAYTKSYAYFVTQLSRSDLDSCRPACKLSCEGGINRFQAADSTPCRTRDGARLDAGCEAKGIWESFQKLGCFGPYYGRIPWP